ncbi:MAG: alcohol dehydrogenase catalytic domain-containing protein [Clostridiaceae bacterium]|nr:alcohol dehydrogenase catalytic domain-containing protein [Clostridiaceae bacterium]
MRAIVIEKPGVVNLHHVEIPVPPPGFARVKVAAAAVCATDLEVLSGRIPANYPLTPGHEWSGIVDAVGSGEDANWIGKRVIGSNDVVCLKCDACRSGDWRYCREFEEIGFKRNGAYAEYVIVPAYGLCELADSVSFEEAALCEPLGVALGTMEKAKARFAETCLILGAGSIGLCMLAVAKAMGMRRIVVCAVSRKRLSIAKEMGAYAVVATSECDLESEMKKLHPGGTDVVIDATGVEACVRLCLRLAKKGGRVLLAGYGRGRMMNIRIDDIHINNLQVIGAGNNWNMHKKAAMLMTDGIISMKPLVTHVLPLEDYKLALEMAEKRPEGFVKVVLKP